MARPEYPSGEYALLARLERILGPAAAAGPPWELTLGDDAAIRRCRRDERLVMTADAAVEGVHFTCKNLSFSEIGYRVMAANVSDCAGMAALPEAALVNLVFPRRAPHLERNVMDLYHGFSAACRKWRFRLVGGDLSAGACWTIGVTLVGATPPRGRLLRRKGARPGDTLWASGFPGRSAAGLAALEKWGRRSFPREYRRLVGCHCRPEPDPRLGVMLGRCKEVHAMMDLSDGISKDARTMCHENGLGLDILLGGLVPPADMVSLAGRLGRSWIEWFLHGGEEYTLLFAASPGFGPSGITGSGAAVLTPLGTFTGRRGSLRVRGGAKERALRKGGWDHVPKSLRRHR
jgi:thiamine-monophosphate kinase